MRLHLPDLRPALLAATLALHAAGVSAAAEEVQVYLDDLSAPGQFGLDVHNNFVVKGPRASAYPGETPSHHQFRLTPEFYYGLTPSLELGLYVLTSHSAQGHGGLDGSKLRLKFIAPHDERAGAFWGLNLEIGRTVLAVSEVPWNAQLKGIVGWRGAGWTLGGNANIDWSLSKGGGPPGASLDLKLAHALNEGTQLGLELYSELGPVRRIDAWQRNPKTLYTVLDHELGRDIDLNLGVGRNLTPGGDRWTLKLIVGTHF
jgi:hypothetical protein